jgi:hypothetical protein
MQISSCLKIPESLRGEGERQSKLTVGGEHAATVVARLAVVRLVRTNVSGARTRSIVFKVVKQVVLERLPVTRFERLVI